MNSKHNIDDDYEIIEDDFGIVVYEEPSIESKHPEVAEEVPQIPSHASHVFFKSDRRLLWEQRNPKIRAVVEDTQGNQLEIREVNRGKQFGFWNDDKNAQIFVHRQKDNSFECKGIVLRMKS